MSEELPDRLLTQGVVIDQGRDDASLVHRARRFQRGVRRKQPSLPRDAGLGVLHDDGELSGPFVLPTRQAFESVDDLERAVVTGSDPDGRRRQVAPRIGAIAAKTTERRLKLLDGDDLNGAHGRSSRERS